MKLLSTRGWEEFDWILERKFIIDNESYFQFKLKFKTKFWDRKDLLAGTVTNQVDDISCEFSQVAISQDSMNSWLTFLNRLASRDLTDLRIGAEKEFRLIDENGEKLKLTIADSKQNQGYTITVDFVRGRTNFNFEIETDITCLTNSLKEF